uniref:Uncharacterized protein n=1 Tax=Populus trichocarpa TaxID=3694 RepID=A0A2K1YVA5_POPTR
MGTLNKDALHSSCPSSLSEISLNKLHQFNYLSDFNIHHGIVRKTDRFRSCTSQIYNQYPDSTQLPNLL